MVTDLLIDHVTHGHSNLHACPLDVVEIEMVKHSQESGGQRNACSIAIGLIDCRLVVGVITLKELYQLPKQQWLNDFDGFLMENGTNHMWMCCFKTKQEDEYRFAL